MRGPLVKWFEFVKQSMGLGMGYVEDRQHILEEVFLRRNVIVHNAGIANTVYLSKIHSDLAKNVDMGDDMAPSKSYVADRVDIWNEICVLVGAEYWKKKLPDDGKRTDLLIDLAYNHLQDERWNLSAALSEFVVRDSKANENQKTIAQLNLWQARKWSGEWNMVKSQVEGADYSAKSLRFQVAILALMDENDRFFELLPKAIAAEEIEITHLKEYPIFRELRKDSRFDSFIIQSQLGDS